MVYRGWLLLIAIISVFITGLAIGNAMPRLSYSTGEKPLSFSGFSGIFDSPEMNSPADRIPEQGIHVFSDKIVVDIANASWASFTDTNSMDPFIDSGANSIEIKPQSEDEVKIGDVISFRTEYAEGLIIHRVVGVGQDDSGKYFMTKGDNNPNIDPGKRRFSDINGVVVAVVY